VAITTGVRSAIGVLVAACLATCCTASAEPSFLARSADGRVSFSLSESTAREAFDSFCSSSEAQVRCDAFDKYRMELGFGDGMVGLTFIHHDIGVVPLSDIRWLQAFGCMWVRGQMECRTGDHRY
jgi:hypothetical protein